MPFDQRDAGEVSSATAASVLDVLERRDVPLHPHLRRELLVTACEMLDRGLMLHQVPAYPSAVPVQHRSRPE